MLDNTSEAGIFISTLDAELKDFLKTLLEGEGYKFNSSDNPEGLLQELTDKKSDVLILDFKYPNALDICKKIRANFTLRHTPIILLVEKEDTIDKIKGIYAGADDYAEKPLAAGELLTRIKANIWRANRDLDANPLTKLPGNVSILKEIEKRIKSNEKFCLAYVDLNKFKEYNDHYGFEWGDNVIKHTAALVSNTLITLGSSKDFLGHIGGDDFIFITVWESIQNICEEIIEKFDKTISSFYKKEDISKRGIFVKNRMGKICHVPIMSISIGVTANEFRPLRHVGEVIQLVTELKTYAKTFSKSIYVIDRRKG